MGAFRWEHDPEYDLVPKKEEAPKKGFQCGECGVKFDYGESINYMCSNNNCPLFLNSAKGWSDLNVSKTSY